MTATNDDLLKKIEEMRQEMDSINRSVASLRQDGMTRVFREQIGASFLDHNRGAFRAAIEDRRDITSGCSRESLGRLSELYDNAIDRYKDDDLSGAMHGLDELRGLISQVSDTETINRTLLEVVDRARQQMASMETLRFQTGRPMLMRSCESVFGEVEPERMETYLTPLSSAIRLKILAMLYTSSRSFTEISKELDMKKGHLQFHLRKLVDAGYVSVDPRTHLYCIEEEAFLILGGLGRLFSKIC